MIFETEIKWIKSERAKELAFEIIHEIEPTMKGPSSSSGSFHPKDENAPDGLVKHCRRVCWWVVEFCKENKFDEDTRDAMLIAAMIHDYARSQGAYYNHGLLSWKFINKSVDFLEKYQDIKGIINKVKRFSATHMNHWDYKAPQPKTIEDYTFAMCDYAASRRSIHTPFLGENYDTDG